MSALYRVAALLLAVFAGLLIVVLWLSGPAERAADTGGPPLESVLGGDSEDGFSRATGDGRIRLPEDHGAHPDYRSEWWYFTGSLEDEAGRLFGFQLTFFRFALTATEPAERSIWSGRQVYMAHFALTDVASGEHRAVERYARSAAGLAGARAVPFAVWLDDWSATSAGLSFLPLSLAARDAASGLGLELELQPGKPPVRHGDEGLSVKGPEPGNASWYYSYTRLPARGSLSLDGRRHAVSGYAWLDREWSTSSLGGGAVGWDWFGLQLNDGTELMLYVLRNADGEALPTSAGSMVGADGRRRPLQRDDFAISPVQRWRSGRTGIAWPVEWRIEAPGREPMRVRALLPDQEQVLSLTYWEGAVEVLSVEDGARLGRGYMELTGYEASQANSAR